MGTDASNGWMSCEMWKMKNEKCANENVAQLALKQLASFEPNGKLSKKQQKIGILAIGPPCRNVKMWLTRCFGCSFRQLFLWTRIRRKYAAHIQIRCNVLLFHKRLLFLVISNHYRFVRTATAELTIIFSLVFLEEEKQKIEIHLFWIPEIIAFIHGVIHVLHL